MSATESHTVVPEDQIPWCERLISDEEMKRLLADTLDEKLDETDCATRVLTASMGLLHRYLGTSWVQENIVGNGPQQDYFGWLPAGDGEARKAQIRIHSLAEMIFNFQHVEGIEARVEQLRRSKPESAVAELDAAQLAYMSKHNIRFVAPTGKKGKDYDMEVDLPDGTAVACETKCKLEGTAYNESAVRSAASKARRQLPRDRPTAVFVKIPRDWLGERGVIGPLLGGLRGVFTRSKRIGLVVFFWEIWKVTPMGQLVRAVAFLPVVNQEARHQHGQLPRLLTSYNPATHRWRYLHHILCEHDPNNPFLVK